MDSSLTRPIGGVYGSAAADDACDVAESLRNIAFGNAFDE